MGREEKDRVGINPGSKTGKQIKNQTTAERGKEKTGRPAWRLREINPNRHKRNMLYLLLHPFRRMRATSPEGGSFAENKEKILNLICFCPFVPHPLPYSLLRL